MSSVRLRNQGFVNLHRKPILRLLAILLAAYLFYVPDLWTLGGSAVLCTEVAGALLVFLGIMGRTLASVSIGGLKDRVIMKTEFYSVCRNPLYFSSFLLALGVGLLTSRLDFTLLAGTSYLAVFYPMMLNEARVLREKFPDFAEYERRVPLFFPNFSLWQERRDFEINFIRVKRTLLDSSLVLLAIPVMIWLHQIL